jgi:galactokinase
MNEPSSSDSMRELVKQHFRQQFSAEARWCVFSPGRINLIGEHVDYSGGLVLPAAIDRWMVAAIGVNGRNEVRLFDARFELSACLPLRVPLAVEKGSWLNYPKGVLSQIQERGITIPGFDLCFSSNLPTGGGLSSSAALEVMVATAVELVAGIQLDPREKARLCQQAEHRHAGVPCGIMDQAAVVLAREGHFLLLDCADFSVEHVRWESSQAELMLIDSGVHHQLASGEYRNRRDAVEKAAAEMGVSSLREVTSDQVRAFAFSEAVLGRRALHVATEIERTRAAVTCLVQGDCDHLGKLIQQSHHSLRYGFEVSCPELDFLASCCNAQPGVMGSRMMGGGFGGSVLVLLERAAAPALQSVIELAYREQFGLKASFLMTRPSGGVRVEACCGSL